MTDLQERWLASCLSSGSIKKWVHVLLTALFNTLATSNIFTLCPSRVRETVWCWRKVIELPESRDLRIGGAIKETVWSIGTPTSTLRRVLRRPPRTWCVGTCATLNGELTRRDAMPVRRWLWHAAPCYQRSLNAFFSDLQSSFRWVLLSHDTVTRWKPLIEERRLISSKSNSLCNTSSDRRSHEMYY